MSVTIDSLTIDRLTAQPFGYDEVDVRAGLTARRWEVSGLLTPSEWLSLLSIYDAWRDLKIQEGPAVETGVIGATVPLSSNGPGGQTWTDIGCWFAAAPVGSQAGSYISVSCQLVDAEQALAILLKQQELEEEEDELDLGTFTINGAVLKLLKPPDAYAFTPTLEQTANGSHYVTGALSATLIKDIEGETDGAGWGLIRSWYQAIVQTTPATNTYFPIEPPTASAANKVVDGAKVLTYTVNVKLALVK